MPIFKTRKLFIKYFKVNWGVTYFVLKVFIFSKKEHMLPVKMDSRYSVKEKKVTKREWLYEVCVRLWDKAVLDKNSI